MATKAEICRAFWEEQRKERYRQFWEEVGKDHGAPAPEALDSDPALAAAVYTMMAAVESADTPWARTVQAAVRALLEGGTHPNAVLAAVQAEILREEAAQ